MDNLIAKNISIFKHSNVHFFQPTKNYIDIKSYLDYNDQLHDVYRKLNLQSIDDIAIEDRVEWNNKNFISYFSDVTRSRKNIIPFDKSDFKMYDDFAMLSGDIKFCAGMLHYLIKSISTDTQQLTSTLMDRRYIMHVSFGYQSIYHFWDRIGDLLWLYFPTEIEAKKVYTGGVLERLPDIYKQKKSYKRLKELYGLSNHFFRMRHDIVHKYTLGTEIFWERMDAYGNVKKENRLLNKVKGYRTKITDMLPQCLEALYCALELILELPKEEIME